MAAELGICKRIPVQPHNRYIIGVEESTQLSLPIIQQGDGGHDQHRIVIWLLFQIVHNEGKQLDRLT
ncbi:hypothetical protein D3C87_1625700 [compost metagenome]